MSDYERYGDYNSTDEKQEHRPSLIGRILKILFLFVLITVCLIVAARLILSGYYPRTMKQLYMTDALTAYRAENALKTERLKIDVPFDHPKRASFCAANLIVEREAGALQLSVRFNRATFEILAERLGVEEIKYSGRSEQYFRFSLLDDFGNRYEPSYQRDDSYLWYHATKLCFDGVDFSATAENPQDANAPLSLGWIRLDVYLAGEGAPDYTTEPYASIPVYVIRSEVVRN